MWEDLDKEYEEAVALLPRFSGVLESLMRDLLNEAGLRVHEVICRIKSKDSTIRKLQGGGGPRPLSSLTDILGMRVITYFRTEVETAARIVEREFLIDRDHSVDKSAILAPDRFGYLSVHYVAQLSPSRVALTEYRKYGDVKFEIQIRSILQHAWAEIEHDLGYKTTAAVPREMRRRFSRLAGLLELADDEFVGIRTQLQTHQSDASTTVSQGIWSIEIDQDSLASFVMTSPLVREMDRKLASMVDRGLLLDDPKLIRPYIGRLTEYLSALGFSRIADIGDYLEAERDSVIEFARRWLESVNAYPSPVVSTQIVPRGVTVYYMSLLRYAQALASGSEVDLRFENVSSASLERVFKSLVGPPPND